MTDDRTELQKLLSRNLTPDTIRWGNQIDWRFFGDFNKELYQPEPIVDSFVDSWEMKVAMILRKHCWGMWIIDGPRGSGKSLFAVTCAFYFKQLYGRPVASNFPLKPGFGQYRTFELNDIRDQLDRLRALPKTAGTADWKAVNLARHKIWLPRHVLLDDEFHREADKRRPGTDEIKLISELVNELRHYECLWLGLTPDKDQLDSKRIDNDMFISTEVRCVKEVDPFTGKHYSRGIIYQNEDVGGQRIGVVPDVIRIDVARYCNLYWTQGVGSGGTKLEKRPPRKAGRHVDVDDDDGVDRDWEPTE